MNEKIEINQIFEPTDINLSLWVKLHNYYIGVLGRKDMLKEFCLKSGIDYPLVLDERKHLPTSAYLIENAEFIYLGKVRDKIILNFYEKYVREQRALDEIAKKIKVEIQKEENTIDEEHQKLTMLKQKLRSTKDSLGIINLESRIATQEAKIKNEKDRLLDDVNQLNKTNSAKDINYKNWAKQVEMIENTLTIQENHFAVNLTKKIRKKLNFTDFKYNSPLYIDSVKEIIHGEYDNDK